MVKEFKASLYDRKYPRTVTLLKYTLWLLVGVLITVCGVEWGISFSKVAESLGQFRLVKHVTERLDFMGAIAYFARTKDMIVKYICISIHLSRDIEELTFYGANNFDLTQTRVSLL